MNRGLILGQEVPNFDADTTKGKINFHEWCGDDWVMFFTHPADFTPVCTTELSEIAKIHEEFKKRNCKVIDLSCNSVEDHVGWIKDAECFGGYKIDFPLIADEDREIAKLYGMLPSSGAKDNKGSGLPKTVR